VCGALEAAGELLITGSGEQGAAGEEPSDAAAGVTLQP